LVAPSAIDASRIVLGIARIASRVAMMMIGKTSRASVSPAAAIVRPPWMRVTLPSLSKSNFARSHDTTHGMNRPRTGTFTPSGGIP
jgi:hypothetical protein